jgi:competence protein ComEC
MRSVVLGRLLLAYLLGIMLANYLPFNTLFVLIAFILFSLSCFIQFYYARKIKRFTFHWLNGISLNFIFIFFGSLLNITHQEALSKEHFSKKSYQMLKVVIVDDLSNNNLNNRYLGKVIASDLQQNIHGKILIYTKDKTLALGSILNITSPIISFQKNRNPGEFNAQAYWNKKQVFHFVFLKNSDSVIGIKQLSYLKKNSLFIAYKFDSILKKHLLNEESYKIASALLLGSRTGISEEVIADYSKTGTIHILSVSGLHVSVIFLVLNKILSLFKWGKTQLLKSIILISFVCLYAYITGLSPSVCRSAVMISFSIIGKQINHQSNPFNLIAGSAFFLLIIDPAYLLDIGFQLSYLAVLGIIYFYDAIYRLCYFENKFADQIWMLIAVSIAAQLSTLAISLYYFHQFPNYFLLANLLAIPLSSIALYLGIALLALNPIPFIAKYIGLVLSKCIALMGYILHKISILPYALSYYYHIDSAAAFLLMALLLCYSFYLIHYIKWMDWFGAGFGLLFLIVICSMRYQEMKTINYLIHQKDSPCILIKSANQYTLVCSQNSNQIALNKIIQNFQKIGWHLTKLVWVKDQSLVRINGKSFLFMAKPNPFRSITSIKDQKVDYLLCAIYNLKGIEENAIQIISNKTLNTSYLNSNNYYSTYDNGYKCIPLP